MVEGGISDEKRLARQLSAMVRALVEEIAFQESRQRQLASIMRERALEFAARPSVWPVRGPINSDFGYRYMSRSREYHKGLDIGVPVGTPIVAPADGKVVAVGYESGYGLMVVIEHRHGVSTAYAHLKAAAVEPGEDIARGSRIAFSGMSGRTTGSHLHYEVRVNGQPVDPMNYMLN
jgi:murein DD-endopeptidase MepM/ murein hydrolase activator NlpD